MSDALFFGSMVPAPPPSLAPFCSVSSFTRSTVSVRSARRFISSYLSEICSAMLSAMCSTSDSRLSFSGSWTMRSKNRSKRSIYGSMSLSATSRSTRAARSFVRKSCLSVKACLNLLSYVKNSEIFSNKAFIHAALCVIIV